jgi:cytochrome c peroxidase
MCVLMLTTRITPAQAENPVTFSAAEARTIASFGPWPPTPVRDASNRVSGNARAAQWGARLFEDARLSANGQVSCKTCHDAQFGFGDGRKTSVGLAPLVRNSPATMNLAGQRWLGWDGGSDSLWAHSLRPMLDAREMGASLALIAARVRDDPTHRADYQAVFGQAPSADDEALAVDAAKALAAFQETLVTPRNGFDAFRDALVAVSSTGSANSTQTTQSPQNAHGMGVFAVSPDAQFSAAAQRGLKIFVGKGNCFFCHTGPKFSNGEFADIGIPFFTGVGQVDNGRYGGIIRVRQDRYNQLGRYNDAPTRADGLATRTVDLSQRNFGEWKVPSLRGVSRTAPYMHNGSLATLRDVVRHYSELNPDRLHTDGEAILKPLKLTDQEMDDLVAFLQAL